MMEEPELTMIYLLFKETEYNFWKIGAHQKAFSVFTFKLSNVLRKDNKN